MENASHCVLCPAGFHQDVNGSASCLPCIPGRANNREGQLECDECGSHTYTDTPRSLFCVACAPGRKQITPGSAACINCGAGEFGGSGGTCTDCPAGWFRNPNNPILTACQQCTLGTTSEPKASVCSGCDLGKFGSSKGVCGGCPAGTYQDGKGSRSCKPCPVDTFGPDTNATSNAQCQDCPAERSTGTATGAASAAVCLCRRSSFYQKADGNCTACPGGADCSLRDGVGLRDVLALPGFWQPHLASGTFIPCARAYKGSNANLLAEARCCPASSTTGACGQTNRNRTAAAAPLSSSSLTNMSSWNPSEQCAPEYTGPLCRACAVDHVPLGDDCRVCRGGSDPVAVLGVLLGGCGFVFLVMVMVLIRHKPPSVENTGGAEDIVADTTGHVLGQIKILISMVQILSSFSTAYDGVPWPVAFKDFSLGLSFVNLDFLYVLAGGSCRMALPFLDRLLIHLAVPLLLAVSLGSALAVAAALAAGNKKKRTSQRQTTVKVFLFLLLLLFPGLATRLFQTFRCQDVPGVGSVLEHDFAVACYKGTHSAHLGAVACGIAVYIVGIPATILQVLWKNRRHLHDAASPKHEAVLFTLGGLYSQYEPRFWWFELATLLTKMLMTGALVIAAPGSPVQLLAATLVMMGFMLLVLKTSPFVADGEDVMSFVSTLTLVLTTLGGFTLIMDQDRRDPTFHADTIGVGLVALNSVVIAVQLGYIVLVKARLWRRIAKRCCPLFASKHQLDTSLQQPSAAKITPVQRRASPPQQTGDSEGGRLNTLQWT